MKIVTFAIWLCQNAARAALPCLFPAVAAVLFAVAAALPAVAQTGDERALRVAAVSGNLATSPLLNATSWKYKKGKNQAATVLMGGGFLPVSLGL